MNGCRGFVVIPAATEVEAVPDRDADTAVGGSDVVVEAAVVVEDLKAADGAGKDEGLNMLRLFNRGHNVFVGVT